MLPRFRPTLASLAVAAAACSGDAAPTQPALAGDRQIPVRISGFVRDSIGGSGIAAALVSSTVGETLTDAHGRFEVLAVHGRTRLRVAHPQYRLKGFDRTIRPDAVFTLELAPLAPTVLGCTTRLGVMWLMVTDLQGRKTVVRRDSSGVTLGEGTRRRWVPGQRFKWRVHDDLTWLVRGPDVSADEIGTAVWRLFDTDGNVRPHACGRAPVVLDGEDGEPDEPL